MSPDPALPLADHDYVFRVVATSGVLGGVILGPPLGADRITRSEAAAFLATVRAAAPVSGAVLEVLGCPVDLGQVWCRVDAAVFDHFGGVACAGA